MTEIGQFEIFVDARHRIGAEGVDDENPATEDDIQSREVGVGRYLPEPMNPLHQLVGDVIILGEQLAERVEGHGSGRVRRSPSRSGRRRGRGGVPACALPGDFRDETGVVEIDGFGERGPWNWATEIGRMVGIAFDGTTPSSATVR